MMLLKATAIGLCLQQCFGSKKQIYTTRTCLKKGTLLKSQKGAEAKALVLDPKESKRMVQKAEKGQGVLRLDPKVIVLDPKESKRSAQKAKKGQGVLRLDPKVIVLEEKNEEREVRFPDQDRGSSNRRPVLSSARDILELESARSDESSSPKRLCPDEDKFMNEVRLFPDMIEGFHNGKGKPIAFEFKKDAVLIQYPNRTATIDIDWMVDHVKNNFESECIQIKNSMGRYRYEVEFMGFTNPFYCDDKAQAEELRSRVSDMVFKATGAAGTFHISASPYSLIEEPDTPLRLKFDDLKEVLVMEKMVGSECRKSTIPYNVISAAYRSYRMRNGNNTDTPTEVSGFTTYGIRRIGMKLWLDGGKTIYRIACKGKDEAESKDRAEKLKQQFDEVMARYIEKTHRNGIVGETLEIPHVKVPEECLDLKKQEETYFNRRRRKPKN